jgi:hypothetical protein
MRRSGTLALAAAVCLATAATAAARPPAPAPDRGSLSPPRAWVATPAGDRWLAFSTSCWTTGCIDYVNPEMRRDLPRIAVRRGEVIRFHLGFAPRSLSLRVGTRTYTLRAGRTAAWRVRGRGGVLLLQAFGGKGDAGYVARLVIRAA